MVSARATRKDSPCPVGRAVEAVGDRWVLLILRNATLGTRRFDEFRAELGIADNVLSNRLSRLVEGGLLTKVPYRDGGRTRQEYRLTEAGADLLPVLNALAQWGGRHTTAPAGTPPMRIMHRTCGGPVTIDGYCEACDIDAPRAETAWLRPWHAHHPAELAEPVTPPAP